MRAIDAVRSGGAKAGLHTGGFGVTLATYRGPIPTPNSALTVVITTAVLLVVMELLAHAPEPQTADSPTAGDPP